MKRAHARYTTQSHTQRPSWVAARKFVEDKRGKHVTWSPVEETSQDLSDPYRGIPAKDIWYTQEDLRAIRIHNEMVVSLCSMESDKNPQGTSLETPEDTMRGLENWSEQGAWERFERHRDCLNKVLDEQDRQKGIDKMEYQNMPYPLVKRINHSHIPFDHDRLAALCRDATAKARRMAFLRGKRDHQAAIRPEPERKTPNVPEKKTEEVVKPEKEVDVKDCQTVQTAVSTQPDCSSSNPASDSSTEAAAAPREEELPAPPLPRFVRCGPPEPVTKEDLEKKHRERYAAYLVNRQERIEARERAHYEWDQRRLARQAAIRMEADANIGQLKRILKLSNELVELVAATDIV